MSGWAWGPLGGPLTTCWRCWRRECSEYCDQRNSEERATTRSARSWPPPRPAEPPKGQSRREAPSARFRGSSAFSQAPRGSVNRREELDDPELSPQDAIRRLPLVERRYPTGSL